MVRAGCRVLFTSYFIMRRKESSVAHASGPRIPTFRRSETPLPAELPRMNAGVHTKEWWATYLLRQCSYCIQTENWVGSPECARLMA